MEQIKKFNPGMGSREPNLMNLKHIPGFVVFPALKIGLTPQLFLAKVKPPPYLPIRGFRESRACIELFGVCGEIVVYAIETPLRLIPVFLCFWLFLVFRFPT